MQKCGPRWMPAQQLWHTQMNLFQSVAQRLGNNAQCWIHMLLFKCICNKPNINQSMKLWLLSYLTKAAMYSCAPNSMLTCKQMKWALQNSKLKIRTISCHRRIKHRSNARATTFSSAYMWADVALLKLHCRPNDLDCWVEALDGSTGWLSISLPPLHVRGESVLQHWMSVAVGGQAQKCNPARCQKHLRVPKSVLVSLMTIRFKWPIYEV